MAKSALPWLKRLCALYQKHEPSVYGCTAEPHSSGVLITLELDRGSVYLLALPRARSGAYASTASMDIAIHSPPGAGRVPGNGELVARQFIALLQRADKGDVHIKSHGVNSTPSTVGIVNASEEEARVSRQEMAQDLHYAAFLAHMIREADEGALDVDDSGPAHDGHVFLFKALPTGFSRRAFRDQFGFEANDLAAQAFETLLALRAITIDDDAVLPTISEAHDVAMFQTFFLSPEQRAAADRLWSGQYDEEVDYPRLLSEALASDS